MERRRTLALLWTVVGVLTQHALAVAAVQEPELPASLASDDAPGSAAADHEIEETPRDVPLPDTLVFEERSEEISDGPGIHELVTSLAASQDEERGRRRPWFDWRHPDFIPFGGLTQFSSRFKSSTTWCAGLLAQLPMPALANHRYGIFAGGVVSDLRRNLEPPQGHESGIFEMATLGGEYDFTRENGAIVAGRLGAAYVFYNGIAGARSGPAGVIGLEIGIYREKEPGQNGFGIVYTPMLVLSTHDYILFHAFGILIRL